MTPLKWLRLFLLLASAKSTTVAFGLLLGSATLFYFGYIWWDLSWLGNIAAALITASVTAVVIDRVIVRHRRARLTTVLESGRRQLEDRCRDLYDRVISIREEVRQARPEPPYWIAGGGYTPKGMEDRWRFWLQQLNKALDSWALLTGYSLRSMRVKAINDALTDLNVAYTEAMDAYERLDAHMRARFPPPGSLLGEPPQPPDENLEKLADAGVDKVGIAVQEVIAKIEAVKADAGVEDLLARAARRHPLRLPRWLQFLTVLFAAAWIAVISSAWLEPAAFPANFLNDNLLNIAANTATALFAGALTMALAQGRRVVIAKNALPYYSLLLKVNEPIYAMAMPPGHADLRSTLAETADHIIALTSSIQNENPSAELAFWVSTVTDRMRFLSASQIPLFISAEDAVDKFSAEMRPPRHRDLAADNQALFAREKARVSSQPSAPTPQLVSLLEDILKLQEAAHSAAEAKGI